MQALSLALRQVLAREAGGQAPPPQAPPPPFPDPPTLDFRVGRLALGRDEKSGRFVLWAHRIGRDEEAPPDFVCQLDVGQAGALCDAADGAVAGGRPVCILCGEPIDSSGHLCLRRNGHSEEDLPAAEGEEG